MHVLKHYLGISKELPPRVFSNSGIVPVGLDNGSNNCYCNAVLQALFPVREFRDNVIKLMYSEAEITSCLGRLYERCVTSSGVQSARKLLQKICIKNEEFIMGDQQDAHEFLTYLINTIIDEVKVLEKNKRVPHSTMMALTESTRPGEKAKSRSKDHSNRDQQKSTNGPKNRDWLSTLVEGYARTETRCHTCDRVSGTVEPFITLSLDIFENSTIDKCIKKYCAPELLTGKDRFFCDFCEDYSDASKAVLFEELPPLLIIHLKRFKFNMPQPGTHYRHYHEPFERLQYSVISNRELMLESRRRRGSVSYELFAIVSHVGTSPHYGHYVAISEVNNRWYSCDDLSTTKVADASEELGDESTDGNPNSYILFYRMIS